MSFLDGFGDFFGGLGNGLSNAFSSVGNILEAPFDILKNIGNGFANLLNGLGNIGPLLIIGIAAAVILPKILPGNKG